MRLLCIVAMSAYYGALLAVAALISAVLLRIVEVG